MGVTWSKKGRERGGTEMWWGAREMEENRGEPYRGRNGWRRRGEQDEKLREPQSSSQGGRREEKGAGEASDRIKGQRNERKCPGGKKEEKRLMYG